MTFDCVLAGFGGQGILSAGMMLAYIASGEEKNVTWFPSSGAVQRGGTANCSVVISDEEIGSPVVSKPTFGIVMNLPSFIKFEPRFAAGAKALLDTSLVSEESELRSDVEHYGVKATDIARELGNVKVANMVMIGALLKISGIFDLDTAKKYLPKAIAEKHHKLIPLNERALERGWEEIKKIR